MALQLIEGQDFGAHYSLLHRITARQTGENWLALDAELNERVLLKIFSEPLGEDSRATITTNLAGLRGLIHPNIARVYSLDRHDNLDYIASQYVKGAQPWQPSSGSFSDQWPTLEQIFEALEFAHSLSVAHGHLHPGNLLIDDQNNVHITDFGLPPALDNSHDHVEYLSPQIREGRTPDVSDDIYSLGCHLFRALTGRAWQSGENFQTDAPIPEDIRRIVSDMLSDSPWQRPSQLPPIHDALASWVSGEREQTAIEVRRPGFSRQPASTAPAGPSTPGHRLPRERQLMSASTALVGFAILLLLAAGIFFYLPETEPEPTATRAAAGEAQPAPPTKSPTVTGPGKQELAPVEIARRERLREEGKELANELVRLQVRLEDSGVQVWAPDKYRELVKQSNQGDTLYREGKYQQAADVYRSAITGLEDLKANMDKVAQRNAEAGEKALAEGNVRKAIEAYTILTAIDPENEAWAAGLERAENLEKVLARMEEGRAREDDGNLDEALKQFRLARNLDPKWQPAGEAVERVRGKIARQNFTDAMSRGFTALADDNYEEARTAFRRAQKIFPDSPEPDDGLQQVNLAEKLDTIEAHKEAAANYEREEQWQQAIKEYEAALAMDETLTFAQKGLERARQRLELHRTLDELLADPAQMRSDEALASAKKAVVTASRIDNPGPALKRKVEELSGYISLARVPVTLEINSDNETRVTVYKVGRLGRLDSRELELIPGKYTIVGEREGYRNVQKEITLLAGQGPKSVYISCTERI